MKFTLTTILLFACVALATAVHAQNNTGIMTTDSAAVRTQEAAKAPAVNQQMQQGRSGIRGTGNTLEPNSKGKKAPHSRRPPQGKHGIPPGQEGKTRQIQKDVKMKTSKVDKSKLETPDPMAIPVVEGE